ncbi:MAG: hypothetical protein AAF065_03085 [Verrucomicrobiota bacterium]
MRKEFSEVFSRNSQRGTKRIFPWDGLAPVFFTFLFLGSSIAAIAEETEKPPGPMDTEGLEPRIADILGNYYERTFGSEANWERIQSIRYDGIIHLPDGSARFTAFKKKPDYCKVFVFAENGGRFVLSYDGRDAWQLNTTISSQEPQSIPSDEAVNFIRDASTGGHLLYPQIEGKIIRLLGTTVVEGKKCYDFEVVLPDGQLIQYALELGLLVERQQITVNAVNQQKEILIHSDFRVIDGLRLPFDSVRKSKGEVIHRIELFQVRTNLGIMPWMFGRPSGDYMPGELLEDLESDLEPSLTNDPAQMQSTDFSAFAPSNFPELSEEEKDSILHEIDRDDLQ